MNLLRKLGIGRSNGWTKPEIPPGTRVYAIGDIHGRHDLLVKLGELIRQDQIDNPVEQSIEIYLGDYVDRGPETKLVIDHLTAESRNCDRRICLKGNHEDILLSFLIHPETLDQWRELGGSETLYSYGVQPPWSRDPDLAARCRDEFLEKLPDTHLAFLSKLPPHVVIGSYLFVHAGIRPGRPLEDQDYNDFLWIRGAFLESRSDHGFIVVHGHTPQETYEVLPNRINIDTWAFLSGRLTCAVLEGENQRFIQASI